MLFVAPIIINILVLGVDLAILNSSISTMVRLSNQDTNAKIAKITFK